MGESAEERNKQVAKHTELMWLRRGAADVFHPLSLPHGAASRSEVLRTFLQKWQSILLLYAEPEALLEHMC